MSWNSEVTFNSIARNVLRNSGLLQVGQSVSLFEVRWISAHCSYEPIVPTIIMQILCFNNLTCQKQASTSAGLGIEY